MPRATASTTLRSQLLWRIQRRYAVTTSEVRVGNLTFPFTRIADPDRVLDAVAEEADRRERTTGKRQNDEHLHLPYWAELWDSAMGMAQVLERDARRDKETRGGGALPSSAFPPLPPACTEPRRSGEGWGEGDRQAPANYQSPTLPISLPTSSTLDLGCGMGLSGTVAAALGANVLFADIEPPALLFARLNSLPWRQRVRARRVNWKTDQLGETFGVILGADIVYERAQWEFLEPFWRNHLAPGGVVIIGEPGRQTGDVFMDWIRARGWKLNLLEEKVETRERAIRVMVLERESCET